MWFTCLVPQRKYYVSIRLSAVLLLTPIVWPHLLTHVNPCVIGVEQDGSVLQTVVAGSGAIQNIVWIPDVGVAVCSNRSKVRL